VLIKGFPAWVDLLSGRVNPTARGAERDRSSFGEIYSTSPNCGAWWSERHCA